MIIKQFVKVLTSIVNFQSNKPCHLYGYQQTCKRSCLESDYIQGSKQRQVTFL